MKRNSRLALYWLSFGFAAAVGCGAKDDGVSAAVGDETDPSQESDDSGDSNSGSSSGGRHRDAGSSEMDAGNPDDHEIIKLDEPDATCAATSAEAPKVTEERTVTTDVTHLETKPVAIYLMLDRSSSMVGLCPTGPACNAQSWAQATGAISAFVGDPASADIKVALGYFPPLATYTDKTATSPLCTGASCGTATVSMRRAADNAASIMDSLNGSIPSGDLFGPITSTPTECGLRGIKSFCAAHRAANNNEQCVGVLITDGSPTECNVNTMALRDIAAANAMDIPIFALGMTGADFTFLNEIATGGGTDCTPNAPGNACDVSGGQAAFLAALNAIRETVQIKVPMVTHETVTKEVPLDCEWNLPDPPEDMKFDKDKVNVTLSATGKAATTLGRVTSEDECTNHPEGWHYDSEDEPKKVLACAGACDDIKKATGAKISIEFGCKGKALE
jgi:Mg-chelatase subunit ChlD